MRLFVPLFAALLTCEGSTSVTTFAPRRRALLWLEPYGNLTTVDEYVTMWAQLKANARPGQVYYAASAYALKANNASLGYATTPAGEAYFGLQMEQLGLPALRKLGLGASVLGMVYVTHEGAIATMLENPGPFIGQLLAKAEEQNLAGFDVDYEPQGVVAASAASFMSFVTQLAAGLAKANRSLTLDISGCPTSFSFECAGLTNASLIPGLVQVNCEDSFGAAGSADLAQLASVDGVALGGRWAPGFEPGNAGSDALAAMLAWLASPAACAAAGGCPQTLSTWAVHEWNVGPQPQWLFDAINGFLDAPQWQSQ